MKRRVYILVLLAALVFHAFYKQWFSWYVLVLAIALPVLSAAASFLPMRMARLRVSVPKAAVRGAKTSVGFVCTSDCKYLAYPPRCVLRVGTLNSMSGEEHNYQVELSSALRQSIRLGTEHCSVNEIFIREAYTYDFLGIFRMKLEHPEELACAVIPHGAASCKPDMVEREPQQLEYRPKRGGGFAEQYELREYREGDSVRDIHWKLTAKTGKLIVREPQEPLQQKTVVTIDLPSEAEVRDRSLDRLLTLSGRLLEEGAAHEIFWYGSGETLNSENVGNMPELTDALARIVAEPPEAHTRTAADAAIEASSIRYHIAAGEDADE